MFALLRAEIVWIGGFVGKPIRGKLHSQPQAKARGSNGKPRVSSFRPLACACGYDSTHLRRHPLRATYVPHDHHHRSLPPPSP